MSKARLRAIVLGGAWVVALQFGCSEERPKAKPVFKVRGTVTYKGQPAEGVELSFAPVDAQKDRTATFASGNSGKGGEFELSTYRPGDGAPAGEYTVTASWPDRRPGAAKLKAAAGEEYSPDRLGGAYANPSTTKLRATVLEQPENVVKIEIP